VLQCLSDKMEQITSEECKKEVFYFQKMEVKDFRNDVILAETCRSDVDTYCAAVEAGDSSFAECLQRCMQGGMWGGAKCPSLVVMGACGKGDMPLGFHSVTVSPPPPFFPPNPLPERFREFCDDHDVPVDTRPPEKESLSLPPPAVNNK
jgi:hypothetical protein